MNDLRDLTLIMRSRFPLVVVETHEEMRFLSLMERVARLERQPLYVWNAADCLRRRDDPRDAGDGAAARAGQLVRDKDFVLGPIPGTRDFSEMLQHLRTMAGGGIYVLLDAHPYLDDPVHLRIIKNIAQEHEHVPKTLVFVSHRLRLPEDLRRLTATFSLVLPDMAAIRALIEEETGCAVAAEGRREVVDLMALRLAGMCLEDARRVLRHCLSDDGALTMRDMGKVLQARQKLLPAGAALEVELETMRFDELAGLANLRRWIAPRAAALKGRAAHDADVPRGLLLVSGRGGGRRAAARAIAGTCGLPLLSLDFSTLSGGIARGLLEALGFAEKMAPCVLWLDALEQRPRAAVESGASRDMLAALLNWLDGRRPGVFVLVTSDDPASLPQDLLQTGRIDETFFIDLPEEPVRADMFRIHLARRGVAPDAVDLRALASSTSGYSAADIEQAVVTALYESRAAGQPVTPDVLLGTVEHLRPASAGRSEDMARLRAWTAGRAMPAH